MVKSFGVPQNDIGKWAGLLAAVFSLCQAAMGVPWGRFSDIYGRKPAILLGLVSTMTTSLMLGFSTNLPMAMVARALAGAGNGNVGILRTTVAEMVPFKELQPRAFSIMPLVWNVGSIFGPMLGGALANPLNVAPGNLGPHPSPLEMFPYLLPNLISAIFFAFGITVGILFLEETLETLHHRRDYGLLLGDKIIALWKRSATKLAQVFRPSGTNLQPGEADPLLKPSTADEESVIPNNGTSKANRPPPPLKEVLNKQSIINLTAYTILALHSMAYDQILPVFMDHKPIGSPETTPYSPPLRFAGGLGMDHLSIGFMSTGYGIAGMLVQFLFFPPLCRKLGVLWWFKAVSCAFPFIYLLTPFAALLPTQRAQIVAVFVAMLLKSWCVIFAFPCSIILLTNSANSLRVLGTLNGFATSMSAIGRATGPAIAGALFTLGMKRGYLIAPWWFLSATSVLGAVVVFYMVEGEGFEAEDEEDDEEDEAERERTLAAAAADGGAQAEGRPGPMLAPTETQALDEDDREEQTYGSITPLVRSSTAGSSVVDTDDEVEEGGLLGRPRRASGDTGQEEASARRPSRSIVRKTSVPIGMGNQGISRKYSSNLGQSLGSQGSLQY